MLSRNPRQQRIFIRKMYKDLLQFINVKSMKNLSGKGRVDRRDSISSESCSGCAGDKHEERNTSDKSTLPNRSISEQDLRNEAKESSRASSLANCSQKGHGLWVLFLFSLLFVCGNCDTSKNQTAANQTDNQCALGLKTPGKTWPTGDINLEYGQPLRIYCILNETYMESKLSGKNASDLMFFRNAAEMEPEYVTVVNSTTSMMYVEKPTPSHSMYYCKLRLNHTKTEAVCLNQVIVGFKPQEPLKFNCISENWQRLVCKWDPAPNDIVTRFSLAFKLRGRAGRTYFECPETVNKLPENTCIWDTTTHPHYRQVYEQWTFRLTAENIFGSDTFYYEFNHFAHVIPSKPVDLSVVNKTYSNALLHWKIPYPMQTYPSTLDYRISYQSQYDRLKTWEVIHIPNKRSSEDPYYNMTGLKHANAVYDVRVCIKTSKATGENYWSEFSDITFKTAPTLPGRAPKTDIGSFEIAAHKKSRDVYVYWQTIPLELQNGDNFTYEIISVEENGKPSERQPSEKKGSFAKFKEISFGSFKVEIVASNCNGSSKDKAVVYVPPDSEKPPEPSSFTKIAFDGGLYELSWNLMSNVSNITNYTIFWCENDRDRPFQCTGFLNWVQVPRNVNIYNTTVPDPDKIYQFAIAANTAKASSGMVWASCTALHNKIVDKMRSVWINSITSDEIVVGWKLDCSDRMDIIQGFTIYYCPIVSPYNVTCKDPMMNTTEKGSHQTMSGKVAGLKPYTTYKLTVAVLTKNGEGHQSDPLYNTTYEAAPTPPQSVSVTKVSNTSINVKWEAPVAVNGMLKYYTVYFNQNVTKVENATSLQIDGLEPYEEYRVRVSAWTAKEGNRSDEIIRRTDIGIPGKTSPPRISFNNSSQVQIKWDPPRHAGGKLDFYEIMFNDKISANITMCNTECEAHLSIPDCSGAGKDKSHSFRIRAVNFGNNMERFEGPWSDTGKGNCYISGPSNLVWVIIWIIGCFSGVAFLMFLGYSSKRIWIKCKAMQDVEVKLPPGLQPNMKLLGKGNEQMSADSSGCSSGQESVTSMTSDSHVSTDSGADLDPVPMSPTKLPQLPPTREAATKLRQRNVSGTTKPDASSDRGCWDSSPKVAKTIDTPAVDSLSLARSTPNLLDGIAVPITPGLYPVSQQHAWSSTGYISMPSSEEDSSNNPSPLLRGKGSAQGVYSVVGLAPSPIPRSRTAAEWNHPRTADLIPIGTETRKEPVVVNPYVSLASFEQKMMGGGGGGNAQVPSLGDFTDMEFGKQVREQDQQPPPYSISDKLSKPYVQTGMMDPTKINRPSLLEHDDINSQRLARYAAPSTAEPIGGRPPFAKNFIDSSVSISQSLIELPSNIYVPVDTARVKKEQNPYVAVSALMAASADSSPSSSSSSSSPVSCLGSRRIGGAEDHAASSYPFAPQLIDTSNTKAQKLADCHDAVTRSAASSPAPLPVVKQTSGYVTIAENPTRSTDKQKFEGGSSSMSYVPHQRVNNKNSPPSGYQQTVGQADEQYSKVTVVPNTTT